MENIQQSPEWPQPENREGNESSSQTAVNNNTSGPGPHSDWQDNLLHHISSLRTSLGDSHDSLAQTIISNQRTEISNLSATIINQEHRIEELELLETIRFGHYRHEILDAFALRGVTGRGVWEVVGCETGHHYGDAVEDGLLYICGYRSDNSVWGRLYSLSPERVMECYRSGDDASISVLNKRATLILTRGNGVTTHHAIEGVYRQFVLLLEQGMGEMPGEDMQSPLTTTYQRFWQICRQLGF